MGKENFRLVSRCWEIFSCISTYNTYENSAKVKSVIYSVSRINPIEVKVLFTPSLVLSQVLMLKLGNKQHIIMT